MAEKEAEPKKGEEKGDYKPTYPEHEDRTTEDLFDEYHGYHEIDAKKKVNRPLTRQKRIKKHRKGLEAIVSAQAPEEGSLASSDSEADAKKKAATVVTQLIHEGYKSDAKDAKKPNADDIRRYLQDAGINATYEDLLQEVINADDLSDYDNLPDNLRALIDHVSLSKDNEGRKIQRLRQTLARHEHIGKAKELVGDATGENLSESANPQQMFEHYDRHVSAQAAKYAAEIDKTYKKTYKKKEDKLPRAA